MEKSISNNYFISGNPPDGVEYKPALQDLLRSFPYFQLAQVMYAKMMYDANEPEAANRIKLASIYAPDRKNMYMLFKKEPEGIKSEEGRVKSQEKPLMPSKKEDVKFRYVYSSPNTPKIEPRQNESFGLAPPLSETFLKKEIENKPALVLPEQKKEPIITAPLKPVQTPFIEKFETLKQVQGDVEINEKYSFASWLKVLPELADEKISYQPRPNRHGRASAISYKPKELIDKFLKDSPRISRPKAEFFSPSKAAKLSNKEDDAIVSETLAKIYFEQGNLHKALKAYETLLADNPEKKNTFAPRIEEIMTLINKS